MNGIVLGANKIGANTGAYQMYSYSISNLNGYILNTPVKYDPNLAVIFIPGDLESSSTLCGGIPYNLDTIGLTVNNSTGDESVGSLGFLFADILNDDGNLAVNFSYLPSTGGTMFKYNTFSGYYAIVPNTYLK